MRERLVITGDKVKPLIMAIAVNEFAEYSDAIFIGSYKNEITEVWSFSLSLLSDKKIVKEISEEESNKILTLINLGLNKLEVFDCLKHLMIKD